LLQEASILLVPSGFEGQPMVILEALACGLPVCASNRILDVPKGVSVAEYSDVSAWAKQVAQVLNSPPSPATLLASSQPFHIKAIQLRWQEVYEAFSVH
jgi:glycosyltransferase involved in cell wall biosynthesis